MKGIILAGGTGSRLFPLTKVTNKHLLPIYDRPMIYYPIQTLKSAGIQDILVITGTHHAGDVFALLGSGQEFGVHFTYRVQDKPGGIPHAIALAEGFVGNDKFISINGDNILFESIQPFVEAFRNGNEKSRILLYAGTTEEAKRAGVAVLKGEKVMQVIEKPAQPPAGNWIAIGAYMYTPEVFDVIRTLKPSKRGELEIADVHNHFIKTHSLKASKLRKQWMDAGTIEELHRANSLVQKTSRGKTK
ncbi:MAG: NTP transferase domain-containing protein [Candidatus Diapherotrites archaeon]|nr:NTP transferase domain-containing protein [Candidatus Diapherotrites archaeon]